MSNNIIIDVKTIQKYIDSFIKIDWKLKLNYKGVEFGWKVENM